MRRQSQHIIAASNGPPLRHGCMLARSFAFLAVIALSGCCTTETHSPWTPATLAPTALSPATKTLTTRLGSAEAAAAPAEETIQQTRLVRAQPLNGDSAFALAELHYAAGAREEAAHAETCVDSFYLAACFSYFHLFGRITTLTDATADARMLAIYNSSLARLIEDGQIHGRLDTKKQLTVRLPEGQRVIPLVAHIGPWQADDIDQLIVVGDYEPEDFKKRYGQSGLGVPVVALRYRRNDGTPRDNFLFEKHPFAATVVLHPDLDALRGQEITTLAVKEGTGARLDLLDAARITTLTLSGRQMLLAADLSAPLQYSADTSRPFHFDLIGFRQPAHVAKLSGLYLMEPYQRGKIPVVFVHGLLSDPHTWDEMLNELRANPDVAARFQFAVYMYPTGNPFLLSAGHLRKKLQEMQQLNDPGRPDPALGEAILVGHSMGGVLSRFQVTRSEDKVWNLLARRPFDQLVASPETLGMLHEAFFFEPQPFVKRVVFIATPHRGSTLARNVVGRIGNALVTPLPIIMQTRSQLLADNPDAFRPAFIKHLPTSVEDLATGSPILDVMQTLPFNPEVRLHSIIGRGKLFPVLQPGDGYVPVTSAHLDGVESELFVEAGHTVVQKDPASVQEVLRILRKHAQEFDAR